LIPTDQIAQYRNLVIPSEVWGEVVITSIIAGNAFLREQLNSVIIPNSVTSIGFGAFFDNQLTNITIGANVKLASGGISSFGNNFDWTYNNNGKQAGTYTQPDANSYTWTRK
jgi:hypothetical protein